MTPLPPEGAAEQFAAVLTKAADREAEVAIAVIDDRADRQLEAIRHRTERAKASPPTPGQRRWPSSRRTRLAVTAIVVTVAVVVTTVVTSGGDAPRAAGDSSQSLHLRDAMTLTVPVGAISDGAAVSADYVSPSPWQYHTAVSSPVEFSTPGSVVGAPRLSIVVPENLQAAAASGAMQLAFRSNDPSGWTEYPIAYDAVAHTVNADLKHFSTWQFWTWDWVSLGANINQTVDQFAGHRASEHAQCTSGIKPPKWFSFAAGITDEPAMIIRSCLQGHQGDDTLDVQIVNNRPYGMELSYNGAPIAYGWHQPAASTAESFRNLVGDLSVSSGQGLYLPPLSRASIGVKNIGGGKRQVFSIRPSGLTLTADALQILTDKLLDQALGKTLGAVFAKNSNDIFTATAGSKCTRARLAINSSMNAVDVTKFILGDGRECVEALLIVLGRNEVQKGSGMDMAKIGEFSTWITKLKGATAAALWTEIFDKYATAVDYFTDKSVEIKELGFGFSILAHSSISDQPAPPPTSTPKPTTPAPTATKAAPPKQAPTTTVQTPNLPPARPAPVTTPAPTPPPAQEVRVNAYDNYGPVTTAGSAMCSGTPSRPESMPGGTVAQEFTVGSGITYLETATVQIDRNSSMAVHAALSVNGGTPATDDRTPADDTTFTFGRVPVHAGDKVTLTLTWSGTAGKLDTIYTTGTPPGSHLVITNTCSDYGSPHNLDTTSTGLRATISGVKS
ncbi:hypothetical protein [Amycolatopsis sp. H20-H5]|uniref:hypothetical protein n=1 Tax=Amycolatopsis sp. H20-H5 TaxID=3046309 RepID=UPI002DBEFE97|nr:hypothetical protein [Amycolatopsis sp. H20-H5]MEC3982385.1 hypothetical protein [Amycolatopsis sp. H20-H5]